ITTKAGTDSVGDTRRENPFAPSRALDIRKKEPRMEDSFDERTPAQTGQLQVKALDRTAARIGGIIDRKAAQTRHDLRYARIALIALDIESREFRQAADTDALELIAQARGDVIQREWPDFFEAQLGERIARIDLEAAVGLIEGEQIELVVEAL